MIIPEADRLSSVKEYYFSKKLQEIRKLNLEGENIINLGIGSPDLPPSEASIKALCDSAHQSGNHGYQSYKCISTLRQAMADWYKKTYTVTLDPEKEILPLIGSKEGIMHISSAFLNPGDVVLVPNPGYPTYTSVSRLLQAEVDYYDLDEDNDWQIDIEELEKKDLNKVKLLWVNYPHMPTGTKGTPEMFRRLIALARKHRFLICNDNPYSLILNDSPQSLLSYEGAQEVLLELNSLSKSHNMAGWRMGWVSGAESYINAILKVKSNIDSGVFLPIQHAATKALQNDWEWHQEQNKVYLKRRELVWQLLDLLGTDYTTTQTGMFVWAKVPDTVSEVEVYVNDILYGAKVFLTPGFIFGTNGAKYIRISLCSNEKLILEATERIRQYLLNLI